MKTNKLNFLFFLIFILGTISCEKSDELSSNLKDIDSDTGLYDFYLYDIISNVTTKITSSPNQIESSYSISPDSKKILYINENGINEMNIDGSDNKILITKGLSPSYSPDGRQVAFVDENKLYVINIDGTNKIQISDKNIGFWHPVWSRDGENIACSSDSGLCIISIKGNLNVYSSSNSADWYDWSNDSKEIYYSKFISNNYAQIFKYDIIENKESQITDIDKYNYSPKCNPNKNEIIFTSSHADYGGDLILANPDGLSRNVILHKNKITSPCWSPKGDKIVFVTEVSNIAIIDKNGDNYIIINEIPGACMEPKWSNDGKYILYYRAIFYN